MPHRRQGFTLIELLVSMALIIFIMAILSEAFVCCAKAFRDFKATGDMAERLRSTAAIMKKDLAADKFEGKKRLSQPDFWVNGPPLEGFFRIYNGSNITTHLEGFDLEGIPSYLVPDHSLHFTVKLRGNSRDNFFLAIVPGGSALLSNANLGSTDRRFQDSGSTFNSQWAEVAWYLVPTGEFTQVTNPNLQPMPLYGLYRRQRVAVPEQQPPKLMLAGTITPGFPMPPASPNPNYTDVSMYPAGLFPPGPGIPAPVGSGPGWYACSPSDLTVPSRRFGMDPTNPAGVFAGGNNGTYPNLASDRSILATSDPTRAAADEVLTDVISFEVRLLPGSTLGTTGTDFVDLFNTTLRPYRSGGKGVGTNNPTFGTAGPHVFDTWSQLADGDGTNPMASYGLIPPQPANNTLPNWQLPGTALSIPMYVNNKNPNDLLLIRAVQIVIRVWDINTAQSRQITIIQDM